MDITIGSYFSGYKGHSCGNQAFARHARYGVLGDNSIEDSIGYLVGNLVRMAFRN
jgi:hypothetical protein